MSRTKKPPILAPEPLPTGAGHWPADFAPPRQSILAAFCVAAWLGILAVLAAGNSLLGLKKALLLLAGARMEPVLGAESLHSVDLAIVLAGFVLVAGSGYIHVALGLAVLLALRPWLDGFTYPTDNMYFLWALLYLLALWAIRQLKKPARLRGVVPLALFGLFYLWCMIAAGASIQFDASYRELLYWAAYGVVLFLAINATPHPVARGLVLVGLFAGMAGQALFAYPHLCYILPWLRDYLQEDPRRLAQWFQGTTEFTPELARRFNLNRAFASMVFPNALAALLILGIPASLACAWNGLVALRNPEPESAEPITRWRWLAPWAICLFCVVCMPLYLLGQLPLAYQLEGPPWFGSPQNLIYLSVGAGGLSATFFLLAARKLGLIHVGAILASHASALLFLLMSGALWITYSRGAVVSLALAVIISALLSWRRHRPLWTIGPLKCAALVAVVTLTLLGAASPFAAQAQGDPEPAPTTVTGEGMDITVRELADPDSMKLRLSYWNVARLIAMDYPLAGVGLGNFRIAYGPYQYLGAGDVQNAHSAPLQVLCEVGVPGLGAFLAFWAWFLIRGGKSIRATENTPQRRFLLGLYGGVLAFLLHSLLDINFSHPSLVMYAMAAAGLFYSYTAPPVEADPSTRARYATVPLLLLAALVGGVAFRPYLADLTTNGGRFINVSNRAMNEARHRAAQYFLVQAPAWAQQGKTDPAPVLPIGDAVALLPEREILFAVGRVLAPDPEGRRLVPLAPESAFPPGAVFQVVRPWDAHFHAFGHVETWLAELERLDRRFPDAPDPAHLLADLYKLLIEQATPRQEPGRPERVSRMLHWAEEAVRRSPMHKDMHQILAWAEWTAAARTEGPDRVKHYDRALAAFHRSRQLGHLEPDYYFAEASVLKALGQSYERAGNSARANELLTRAQQVRSEGEQLRLDRWSLGLQ